jgi:RNA 2',3'-cyclic 3'-phosphodiesterase
MRLFTGLDLPEAVGASLTGVVARLRPTARIAWSPPQNLHVTTKFIGEWPEAKLDALRAALGALASRPAIEVLVRRLGYFPNPRGPRTFWCGVEAQGLDALARETDEATATLGIPAERRPFSPHLTLARIKEPCDMSRLDAAIAALPSVEFGRFTAGSFFLYRSELRPSGSVYTKLAEFPLTK